MSETLSKKNKEVDFLKENVTILTQDLEKLTRGRENLEKLLGSRNIRNQPISLGYEKDESKNIEKNSKDVKGKNKVNEHSKERKGNTNQSKSMKQQVRYESIYRPKLSLLRKTNHNNMNGSHQNN